MKPKGLANFLLLVGSAAIPALTQTESISTSVAEYIFFEGERLSFGPDDVVSVKVYNTTNNSNEVKLILIELNSETELLWQKMDEPNAGHELSYTICGKIMATVFQQSSLMGPASMMIPAHDVEGAKAILLGDRGCNAA